MAYQSRIPVEPSYVQRVGQAFYNFAYLEWIVIWTIVKLAPNGFGSISDREPSSKLADTLTGLIGTTSPPLPAGLRDELAQFDQSYRDAISSRDELLCSHPFTAEGGVQELGGSGHVWPPEAVDEAAKRFEDAAIAGNAIFYGDLAKARP
jgi:hypothetical protein